MESNKSIIEKWVSLFNEGDYQSIAHLYHDDAINHQVANEPIAGKSAIKEMFRLDLNLPI